MSRSAMPSVHAFVRATCCSQPIRLLGLAAAATCVFIAAPHLASQAAHVQNLQQGIALIREILAKEGLYTRTTTTARADYKSASERKFSLSEVDGCHLVVASDSHSHTEMPAKSRVTDRTSTEIYKADFTDMDPASVTVADPEPAQPNWEVKGYLVRISVENGKPLMPAASLDKRTNLYHDMPGLPNLVVYVASRNAADRLAKAFGQVASSCHAHPSVK